MKKVIIGCFGLLIIILIILKLKNNELIKTESLPDECYIYYDNKLFYYENIACQIHIPNTNLNIDGPYYFVRDKYIKNITELKKVEKDHIEIKDYGYYKLNNDGIFGTYIYFLYNGNIYTIFETGIEGGGEISYVNPKAKEIEELYRDNHNLFIIYNKDEFENKYRITKDKLEEFIKGEIKYEKR